MGLEEEESRVEESREDGEESGVRGRGELG